MNPAPIGAETGGQRRWTQLAGFGRPWPLGEQLLEILSRQRGCWPMRKGHPIQKAASRGLGGAVQGRIPPSGHDACAFLAVQGFLAL